MGRYGIRLRRTKAEIAGGERAYLELNKRLEEEALREVYRRVARAEPPSLADLEAWAATRGIRLPINPWRVLGQDQFLAVMQAFRLSPKTA